MLLYHPPNFVKVSAICEGIIWHGLLSPEFVKILATCDDVYRSMTCSFTTCMPHFVKVLAACKGVRMHGMLLYPPHFVIFFALVTFFQCLSVLLNYFSLRFRIYICIQILSNAMKKTVPHAH